MASTQFESPSWIEEEHEKGLAAIPHGDMHLADFDEHHTPIQHVDHVLVESFLSSPWDAADPVDRMTGRKADIAIPTQSSDLVGDSEGHHFSAVHLRSAPGNVLLDAAKLLHKNDKYPWFYNDLDGATQIFRHRQAKPNEPEQFDHLASIGDDHPINELPIVLRPKKTNPMEREIDYGVPAKNVQEWRDYMSEEGISYGMVLDGLALKGRMLAEGVDHPKDLSGKRVNSKSINAWRVLPQKDDMVNYVWRAYNLGTYLEDSGYKNALDQEAMGEMIMDTMAYAKAMETITNSGSLIAKVGIVDINDPHMDKTIRNYFGDNVDADDPDVRKKIHGSLYLRQLRRIGNGVPITYGKPGSKETADVESSLKLFLRSGGEPDRYRGFQSLQEVRDELSGKTRIEGIPKMPGITAQINLPTSISGNKAIYGEHLLAVNTLSAPGIFMEAFLALPPWVIKHYINRGYKFTLDDILKGNFIGSSAGTGSDQLARCAHAMIYRSGDTTDSSGAVVGYKPAGLIEQARGLAINISYPKPSDTVKISELDLVPEDPKRHALRNKTKENEANKLVVTRSGAESTLEWPEIPGHEAVVGLFADAHNKLFINAVTADVNDRKRPESYPPVPIPTVVVAARRPEKARKPGLRG